MPEGNSPTSAQSEFSFQTSVGKSARMTLSDESVQKIQTTEVCGRLSETETLSL